MDTRRHLPDGSVALAVPPFSPDTTVFGFNLLTDLAVTIDGVAYDETSANTGALEFNASGSLVGFLFGTACGAVVCSVSVGDPGSWVLDEFGWVAAGVPGAPALSLGAATYSLRPDRDNGEPEPASLAWALAGLLAAGAVAPGSHSGLICNWAASAALQAAGEGAPGGRSAISSCLAWTRSPGTT